MPGAASRRYSSANYWPGFVDALASLLMVVVFLIMVFALAQVFLSEALSGRDTVLERLTSELDELSKMLDLERKDNADLRISVAQLSSQLQSSVSERDALVAKLSNIEEDLASEKRAHAEDVADLKRTVAADKDSIELQLRDLERLNRDIAALRTVRDNLERKVAGMAASLRERDQQLGQVRDRAKELEAQLADEQERTVLAQQELKKRDIRLAELLQRSETAEQSFSEERALSEKAQRRVALLSQQLAELQRQLAALNEALEASEAKNKKQNTQIVNLGKRLNAALATRVQELARYRSEFFGRLREVLGNRSDIRIVGDRFVFQSEVLFASGEAELNEVGSAQLARLADTLREISNEIPDEIDWVLRVDGHTDERPIHTALFASNWELSSARAISVVKFLIAHGIPPNRLVAAGFGQYQPLDTGKDEIAYRRNRRIEFKLTQR